MQKLVALTPDQEQSRILINQVHPKSQHILRTDRDLISIEEWKKELFLPSRELLISKDQGEVVATVLLTLHPNDLADIRYLTVHLNWQKKGIGTLMLENAERRAREIHAKKRMGLTTVYHPYCPQTDLIDWYLKRGYQFAEEISSTKDQQEAWKEEFRSKTSFKSFWKSL